jgi:tetratricopeptide (TPR) repeat protein
MQRKALTFALVSWLSLSAAARAQDVVTYIDRATGKEATFTGLIQSETPAGITLKQDKTTKTISSLDVTHVMYRLPNLRDVFYKTPFNREKAGLDLSKQPKDRIESLNAAMKEFDELLPQVRESDNATRYVRYRMAVLRVHIAREEPGKREAALAALNQYRKDFPNGWEIVPCLRLLAQMYEEDGNLKGAQEMYNELLKLSDAPKEIKLESNLFVSNLLIRDKQYDKAAETLRKVRDLMPAEDPQRPKVLVYLCQAELMQGKAKDVEKTLTSAINATNDAPVRALAHNTLGDYYREVKKDDAEAFWQYLRVDVLYNGDREEHARALYWLAKLYESLRKDNGKAQECKDKLKKDYETTEYGRRFAAETK